jgi:hypothetical protein
MASRGVHFALTNAERDHILGLETDEEKIDYLQGTIERAWDHKNLQESDKAWLLIHRCLTDDPDAEDSFEPEAGTLPLKLLVLGGRQVLEDESEYLFRLIESSQLAELVHALETVDEQTFKAKFDTYCSNDAKRFGPPAFGYAWEYFQYLRDFVKRINGTGRSILFTVDL